MLFSLIMCWMLSITNYLKLSNKPLLIEPLHLFFNKYCNIIIQLKPLSLYFIMGCRMASPYLYCRKYTWLLQELYYASKCQMACAWNFRNYHNELTIIQNNVFRVFVIKCKQVFEYSKIVLGYTPTYEKLTKYICLFEWNIFYGPL